MHVILFAIALVAGPAAPDEAAIDPRTQLDTTITYALRLLADEQYPEFIQKLAHPDDLKKILETQDIEELARSFAKEKAAAVTAALNQAKDAKPTLNEQGTIAVFKLDEAENSKQDIVFEKKDNLWFIRN